MKKLKILFICSYPPRQCGIATFSKDLVTSLKNCFGTSVDIEVCALENECCDIDEYPPEVSYRIEAQRLNSFLNVADRLNEREDIGMVCVQHEFGLFGGEYGSHLVAFLLRLNIPISCVFHTVLPNPELKRIKVVHALDDLSEKLIVLTNRSAEILEKDYFVEKSKLRVIPHGTHIVLWKEKQALKSKYGLQDKMVLSTFGLLSKNKGIETALHALPKVIDKFPDTLYLVLGKTHPEVVKNRGETYRESLVELVDQLGLNNNVIFINEYLELQILLEYLTLSDIYIFSSQDPNQAVSGTFAYAMSCGNPVISTPIPHSRECLDPGTGILLKGFEDSMELSNAIVDLLQQPVLRASMGKNAFTQMRAFSWENIAISYSDVFQEYLNNQNSLEFVLPSIKTDHIENMTTGFGILQFSNFDEPDTSSGYTIDDNARALITMLMYYEQDASEKTFRLIEIYLNFIAFCQQENGEFYNYVDYNENFTNQNTEVNLQDSNGRTVWALGYLLSNTAQLPSYLVILAENCFKKAIPNVTNFESPRALGFVLKGLYFYQKNNKDTTYTATARKLADELLRIYDISTDNQWEWFEDYLTYANSVLPDALLYAWLITNNNRYREVAEITFDFLLSQYFMKGQIKVISNNGWFHKRNQRVFHGEQPIEVAYTILSLDLFYKVTKKKKYAQQLHTAFSWFLGNNHLKQIMYNPVNGGCYDGLERENVNINQGAESSICYLMARLIVEKYPLETKHAIMPPNIKTSKRLDSLKKRKKSSTHKVKQYLEDRTGKPFKKDSFYKQ
ncbi:glycosyltransferase involved in cell wall biosynthesis [Gillisia sp. Hel_I_86]|uniref:glycosyltransferase n=1 Tax=Gillisia sp. Hel_I_86 TaxID=1249981 RepID=UPI00119C3944|nr:glycosyltransferase [Gillisia sp. Hel_I_86]TVZ28682.1 glycosyltransferase involved in cell wall biosynthesis [Gillisia sp. Hel_I_86]